MLTSALVLLIVYQLKHFFADYPLQGAYMLGKFKPGWDFLGPLSAHCLVHAAMTFFISYVYFLTVYGLNRYVFLPVAGMSLILAALDFIVHFGMDRIKASPKWLGRYKALAASEFPSIALAAATGNPAATQRLRDNVYFWWALGLDQMVHHLTHYAVIVILLHTS